MQTVAVLTTVVCLGHKTGAELCCIHAPNKAQKQHCCVHDMTHHDRRQQLGIFTLRCDCWFLLYVIRGGTNREDLWRVGYQVRKRSSGPGPSRVYPMRVR